MSTLSERDKAIIWHPYTQMQTALPAIGIVKGEGTYLFDDQGNKYIDAISSWWVNLHGHAHPYIAQKVSEQLFTLEQVIFAGFTHEPAVKLAERLLKILPSQQAKVFYSDNGSTAVEVALKMALQYWYNKEVKKPTILALNNAYHGDTFGAMAVSQRGAFTKPFSELLFDVVYVDAPSADNLKEVKEVIEKNKESLAAFIFEPLVQGASGMLMYEAEPLSEMISFCRQQGVLTIADEVMTGFGRTGKLFACDYLSEQPDIMCFSKGLTGGTMPMGITTCNEKIYHAFLSDDRLKALFHGHSFTANPLACTAALASLDLLQAEECMDNIRRINHSHDKFRERISAYKGIKEIRLRGTILAVELQTGTDSTYFSSIRDELYSFFISNNVLIRPLGNIIYLMPPYCISNEDLNTCYLLIAQAIKRFTNESN